MAPEWFSPVKHPPLTLAVLRLKYLPYSWVNISADNLDTDFDVTSIVKKHSASLLDSATYPTGIDNNGFLIKQTDSVEASTSSSFGIMQYFSVTIKRHAWNTPNKIDTQTL